MVCITRRSSLPQTACVLGPGRIKHSYSLGSGTTSRTTPLPSPDTRTVIRKRLPRRTAALDTCVRLLAQVTFQSGTVRANSRRLGGGDGSTGRATHRRLAASESPARNNATGSGRSRSVRSAWRSPPQVITHMERALERGLSAASWSQSLFDLPESLACRCRDYGVGLVDVLADCHSGLLTSRLAERHENLHQRPRVPFPQSPLTQNCLNFVGREPLQRTSRKAARFRPPFCQGPEKSFLTVSIRHLVRG